MAVLRRFLALLALAGSALSVGNYPITPLPGDLIFNGGFESGVESPWTSSGATVQTDPVGAFSGSNYILGPNGVNLAQSFTATPGTTYIVNFHYQVSSSPGGLNVTINGNSLFSFSGKPAGSWVLKTFTFPASTPSNSINFQFSGSIYLDDVSIVPIPSPCNSFYEWDPATGLIEADDTKRYPGPPQPDSPFPVITDAGELLFNYLSDNVASNFPRTVYMGLSAPGGPSTFISTIPTCRFTRSQGTDCAGSSPIGLVFGLDQNYTNQFNLETLAVAGCAQRTIADGKATYTGQAFTIYQDAYTMDNPWDEIAPISWNITVPYLASASANATVEVVSDVAVIEYQPLEVINTGSGNPTLVFTTVARTNYPFVAYGSGTEYTPSPGSLTPYTDNGGVGVCTLYQTQGQVASSTTFCDQNAGVCTVECVRTISYQPSTCVLTGYTWQFDFNEYQDFSLTAPATTQVSDTTWSSFHRNLIFDNDPVWNVCPTTAATDYSRFISANAIHGTYDTSGNPTLDPTTAAAINSVLHFGFKITLGQATVPSAGNPQYPSGLQIRSATLTRLTVDRPSPNAATFYLVGDSSSAVVGVLGADHVRTNQLTFNPAFDGTKFPMAITTSSGTGFALTQVSFIPIVGSDPSTSMLYYSDSSIPGGVTLTVTFTGKISLFADGNTPSSRVKREILWTRQIAISPNGTVADPSQVVNSYGSGNSTTIVIQVPDLTRAINVATIAGSVVGGVVGLLLLAVAVFFYRRSKKAKQMNLQLTEKLETGSL